MFKASNCCKNLIQAASNGFLKTQTSQTNNSLLCAESSMLHLEKNVYINNIIPHPRSIQSVFPVKMITSLTQRKSCLKITLYCLSLPFIYGVPREGRETWRTARFTPIKLFPSSEPQPHQIPPCPFSAALSVLHFCTTQSYNDSQSIHWLHPYSEIGHRLTWVLPNLSSHFRLRKRYGIHCFRGEKPGPRNK